MLTEVELKPMLTLSKAKSIANKKDSLTSKPTGKIRRCSNLRYILLVYQVSDYFIYLFEI